MSQETLLLKAELADVLGAMQARLRGVQKVSHTHKRIGTLSKRKGMVFIPQDEERWIKLWPYFKADSSGCRAKELKEALLVHHLLPFAGHILSENMLFDVALGFFHDLEYIEPLYEALWEPFIFWWLLDWVQKSFHLSAQWDPPIQTDKPFAIQYLQTYPHRLSQEQKKWIRALSKTYYSFYVVMAILPQQLKLKDIFLGTEHAVTDDHAGLFLKAGDIIWSRILTFEKQSICIGRGAYVIPARYHLAFLDYRQDWETEPDAGFITQKSLRQYQSDVNILYFDILGKGLQIDPKPSVSHDGEPFAFCHLYFLLQVEIEKVLKKILSFPELEKDLLEKKRDKHGRLRWTRFYLFGQDTKKKDSVYKGEITLYRKKLKIAVISEARAEVFRALIESQLGAWVTYQKTRVLSIETGYTTIHDAMLKYRGVEVHLEDYPSFEAYLKRLGEIHWTYWLDEPEFALDGLTAREAAQTEEGRTQLNALLDRLEDQNKLRSPDLTRLDKKFIQKQLGI